LFVFDGELFDFGEFGFGALWGADLFEDVECFAEAVWLSWPVARYCCATVPGTMLPVTQVCQDIST
jgi:hypothetical protein